MKIITIATAHSENFKKEEHKKIEIELQGDSPLFAYIWIDDVLYTLIKTSRQVNLKRLK